VKNSICLILMGLFVIACQHKSDWMSGISRQHAVWMNQTTEICRTFIIKKKIILADDDLKFILNENPKIHLSPYHKADKVYWQMPSGKTIIVFGVNKAGVGPFELVFTPNSFLVQ